MITEVKMEVTPDLSKRVQEIVHANRGCNKDTKVQYTNIRYLYIDKNKNLAYGENELHFKADEFKEISAYDFIASQGEQAWLPKYKEKALFSDDKETWHADTFMAYTPGKHIYNKYITLDDNAYLYCKPLSKTTSFIQFLKDNDAYETYMENIKIENQRWDATCLYINLKDIKKKPIDVWLTSAFDWGMQPQGRSYWASLNNKWQGLYKDTEVVWEH